MGAASVTPTGKQQQQQQQQRQQQRRRGGLRAAVRSAAQAVAAAPRLRLLLALLLLLPALARLAAVLRARAVTTWSEPGARVPWACVPATLEDGTQRRSSSGPRFHVVLAHRSVTPLDAWLPWVAALQLSGADVYLYTRAPPTPADEAAAADAQAQLGCGVRLHVRTLLPNRGREAAVYMRHILDVYDSPPDALAFLHGHGPGAWHTQCGPTFRRLRAFFAGLVLDAAGVGSAAARPSAAHAAAEAALVARAAGVLPSDVGPQVPGQLAAFSRMMVALSTGCTPWSAWWPGCCARVFCGSLGGKEMCGTQRKAWRCDGTLAGRAVNTSLYRASLVDQVYNGTRWAQHKVLADFTPLSRPTAANAAKADDGEGTREDERRAYAACDALLDAHNVTAEPAGPGPRFWSCCSTFAVRGDRLRLRRREFYERFLEIVTDAGLRDWHTGRCLEYRVWDILGANTLDDAGLDLYLAVDGFMGGAIRGCPLFQHTRLKRGR